MVAIVNIAAGGRWGNCSTISGVKRGINPDLVCDKQSGVSTIISSVPWTTILPKRIP